MRRPLLILALATTVASQHYKPSSTYYKPVSTPATRIRLHGPMQVADRAECQLACDCARQNSTNCSSFTPPIPQVDCIAYFNRGTGCALLGESVESTCTVTEYVLIEDPCAKKNFSSHGKCVVYDGWMGYCQCEEGYQGVDCEEEVQNNISYDNRTCYNTYNRTTSAIFGSAQYRRMENDSMSYDMCHNFMKINGHNVFYVTMIDSCYSFFANESFSPALDVELVSSKGCSAKCKGNPLQNCGFVSRNWLVRPKETVEPNDCDASPCGVNGLCIRKKGSFTCRCKFGFGGSTCTPGP